MLRSFENPKKVALAQIAQQLTTALAGSSSFENLSIVPNGNNAQITFKTGCGKEVSGRITKHLESFTAEVNFPDGVRDKKTSTEALTLVFETALSGAN